MKSHLPGIRASSPMPAAPKAEIRLLQGTRNSLLIHTYWKDDVTTFNSFCVTLRRKSCFLFFCPKSCSPNQYFWQLPVHFDFFIACPFGKDNSNNAGLGSSRPVAWGSAAALQPLCCFAFVAVAVGGGMIRGKGWVGAGMITSLLLDVLQIGVIYRVRNCSLSHVFLRQIWNM